ncbi:hypothetical protein V6N11_049300 [Hibiscus sabdariffa]|uniref:RNase H type-1 domain-containing protein n=2 Tax=Hibiscus sabdariffa TaxID=183260 RepID=A0ABR2BN09_9ROSI
MVTPSGNWDWSRLSNLLPETIPSRTAVVKLCHHSLGDDVPGWRWTDDQMFTTRSSYKALDPNISFDNVEYDKLAASLSMCPPLGWMKANSDGAVRSHDSMAVAGGMLRDSRGSWLFGFTRSLSLTACSVRVLDGS